MTKLSRKTILVTHADHPVGRAAALACSEAGARVLAHYEPAYSSGDALAKDLGLPAGDTIEADLHIPEHPINLWNAALDRAHRIDGLVNLSGIYKPSFMNGGDLMWMESWRRAIQVNLTAVVDLCRAAEPHFRANGAGVVVAASCPSDQETGGALDAACVAARGGLVSFCRMLSRAYWQESISIYALAPYEADLTLAPERRGGMHDWVRNTPYPSVRDAETTGKLIAMMCAESAPAYAELWHDSKLMRPENQLPLAANS